MLWIVDKRSGEERLMNELLEFVKYDCKHAKLAVHPDVPTNLGWQLLRASQLLHHPGARTPVAMQISYSPDSQSSNRFCMIQGDELLKDALEEENLVEVEVKTEQ
ncbi:hypothetical protein LR48_Vigan01g022800 [Vigna angularis]|uniref:Uncharacterized protein n=1 Tax=Phaseolus angularis TaxID=3914 RepID=A0A0L9TKI5_PHAAN|nr:hypothetical protein LR48_Vigan01g022800 [Vigna angularis]